MSNFTIEKLEELDYFALPECMERVNSKYKNLLVRE